MSVPNSSELVGEARIEVQGTDPRQTLLTPMTLATVIRGNNLTADAHIEVSSAGFKQRFALVRDVLVEDNRVSNVEDGLILGQHTEGVVARNNIFTNCRIGIDAQSALIHEGDRFVNCRKNIVDVAVDKSAH